MDKKVAIIITPNWKDYAVKYLPELLDGLRKQDYKGEIKYFITDNETSQKSFEYLTKLLPDAGIALNNKNEGFAKGTNDSMRLALQKDFEYIFVVNMDAEIEPDCVRKLVEMAERKEMDSRLRGNDTREIGAVQARIMLWPEKDRINSIGNITHFLGFGYSKGYNEKYVCHSGGNDLPSQAGVTDRIPGNKKNREILSLRSRMTKEICYPSGAGVLFRAGVLKEIGLFDEEMWMYNEDQDLGWRIWLAGYKCVLAPDAIVYHKYEFSRSITKYYWMDKNRIIVMLKNYRLGTLLLILPAFIVMELGLIAFAIKGGWMKEKIKVWKYFLSGKNWRYILRARQQSQSLRKVRDRDIISMFSGKIWYQEIDDIKLRLINPVFNAYWWLIKIIIWW